DRMDIQPEAVSGTHRALPSRGAGPGVQAQSYAGLGAGRTRRRHNVPRSWRSFVVHEESECGEARGAAHGSSELLNGPAPVSPGGRDVSLVAPVRGRA